MATWLKLIGSAKRPIQGEYREEHVGFRRKGKPRIRDGDQLFLYAPGGSKRIFALAQAVGEPAHDTKFNPKEEGSCRWKLRVRYRINLSVAHGIPIDDIVSSQRDLTKSIRQASHIRLFPEESRLAHTRLQGRANSPNQSLQLTAGRSDD
jgi:hypothetical protein